jgi:hypothetical protein
MNVCVCSVYMSVGKYVCIYVYVRTCECLYVCKDACMCVLKYSFMIYSSVEFFSI